MKLAKDTGSRKDRRYFVVESRSWKLIDFDQEPAFQWELCRQAYCCEVPGRGKEGELGQCLLEEETGSRGKGHLKEESGS